MGFIPENQINDLKDRIDIIDIISEYVNLKRAGSSFKGLCPFHHEKTPSFSVSPERNSFHCFGCHEGGDAISFIMKIENLSYIDAIRFLADKMGITLEEEEYSHSKTQKRQRMYEINSLTAKYYMKNLLTNKLPQDYMVNRGLQKKILNKFFLGYAKSTYNNKNDDLYQYLKSKNVSKEEMVELGLVIDKNDKLYDRFVERLIFPILNNKNQVIGFGARTLNDSKIKYLNSPESDIFIKGKNLYGVNIINKSRNRDSVLLVEGYMDVIGLYNQGIDNAVATLGTALTPEQANLVKRYSNNILIAYDGDNAGIKATLRAIDIFKNMEVNLGIIELPDGLDPDEYIIKYGKDSFYQLQEKVSKPIDFKLQKLYESNPEKLSFIKEIIEFLAEIDGNTIRDLYTDKAAKFIGVTTDSLRSDVEDRRQNIIKKQDRKNSSKSYHNSNSGYRYTEGQPKATNKQKNNMNGRGPSPQENLAKEMIVLSMIDRSLYLFFKEDSSIIKDSSLSNLYESIDNSYKNDRSIEEIANNESFKNLGLNIRYEELKKFESVDDIAKEIKARINKYKLVERKEILEKLLAERGSDQEILKELADILKKLT